MTFSNKFGNFGFVLFEFLTFSQKNWKKLQILAEISFDFMTFSFTGPHWYLCLNRYTEP
jgi:hypothetical protein